MAWFEVQGIFLISGLSTWKTKLSKVRSVSGVARHPLYMYVCTYVYCNAKLAHLCFVSGIEGQLHEINILCWAKSIHVQWFWRVCGKEELSWAYILGWGIQYNFVVSYWTEFISRHKDCHHPPLTKWSLSYLEIPGSNLSPETSCPHWGFYSFLLYFQTDAGIVFWNMLWPLPCTIFLILFIINFSSLKTAVQ